MHAVLALLSIIAVIIGIVYPLGFLKIQSRKQGMLIVALGLAVTLFATNMMPPSPQVSAPISTVDAAASDKPQDVSRALAPSPSAPAVVAAAPKAPTPQEKAVSQRPDAQKRFVKIVDDAKSQYASGRNEMAKGAARREFGRWDKKAKAVGVLGKTQLSAEMAALSARWSRGAPRRAPVCCKKDETCLHSSPRPWSIREGDGPCGSPQDCQPEYSSAPV